MKAVDLFYLSPNPYGGWVTFTAHLIRALRAAGAAPTLFKIRPRVEKRGRPFGYDAEYRNVSLDYALARGRDRPRLIVAAAKNFREQTAALLDAGAFMVLHDPTEFRNLETPPPPERTIVVRKVGCCHVPGAAFIRHPYARLGSDAPCEKPVWAVSTSRIDFDKRTDLILLANRLLPEHRRVRIHGFENRIYTRFKIVPRFPEWEQSKAAYPRERAAAFNLLRPASYMVDMSVIKDDGGGTQYTTLEAWDAGAAPIIHREWLRPSDDMVGGENCVAVDDHEMLAAVLLHGSWLRDKIVAVGRDQLALHAPDVIGRRYVETLGL